MISSPYALYIFRSLVMEDAGVMAQLRGGISIDRIGQTEVAPYATISVITAQPTDTKDGISPVDVIQLQLDIWVEVINKADPLKGYRAAAMIEQGIWTKVDGFMGDYKDVYVDEIRWQGQNPVQFEDSRDMHRISIDYLMRLKRLSP